MTVSLVGAGPGAPDLITVRGLNKIQNAEVVIHDRLVSPQLIAHAPSEANLINVGKSPQRLRFSQDEINRILVEQALSGKRVVRLKGGDPFVFGLGSSEALALVQANVYFEIVPGLSAATSLAGLAGAALTVRNTVTSFCVLSGHYPPGHPQAADFDHLPNRSTLIVLMGRRHLHSIVQRLLKNGWAPNTPALLVESGSMHSEKVVSSNLTNLVESAEGISSPVTLVIGTGAALRERLIPWLVKPTNHTVHSEWGVAREPNT
ncbi:MAG: uroporphyrinogen-III C-methyltransferase [Myxococcota bacterium]